MSDQFLQSLLFLQGSRPCHWDPSRWDSPTRSHQALAVRR